MKIERFPLTSFLRDPRAVIARLAAADVILQRRGGRALRLSLEGRMQDRDAGTALVAHLLADAAADEGIRDFLIGSLRHELAWVDLLPPQAQDEFLAEFLRTARAGAEIGTGAPVGELLRAWEETAAIYADPDLYEHMTRPLPGGGRTVPEPPGPPQD